MAGFAHLHVASGYSARYGAAHPEHLVRRAAERGMTTLALTDRDTVTGAVRFAQACAGAGVRPVFGVDLAVEALAPLPPLPASRRRTPVRGGAHVVEPPLRFVLLAQNRAGWARLCRITSAAHAGTVGGAAPVVPWEALREHGGPGLIVLLGPLSEPVRALAAGREDVAVKLLAPWREIFGRGIRLEAVLHKRSGTGPGSLRVAARTLALADRTRTTAVLSNAVRYADPDQHRLADVLDAARLLRPIDRRRLDSGQRWLKDERAMAGIARLIAECAGAGPRRASRLLGDTAATAAVCTVDPAADLGLGTPHFPEAEVLGAGPGAGGAAQLLRRQCEAGMARRDLDRDRAALDRLDEELAVISELNYDPYFLAVGQVVADIREKGIRVAARGSGAGSMVCHALGIATANPLDHHLLFERFLSVRRTSLPDIDIDVESARRLECYDTIFDRFGRERVAVTAMPEAYRARRALRDTGLALGIAPAEVDRIAKSFPHLRAADIGGALAELPELRQLAAEAKRYGPLWELAEGLDSLVHGMAMHPCGVVISDATLLDRLPVQPTPRATTRWPWRPRRRSRRWATSNWTSWAYGCSPRWPMRSTRSNGRPATTSIWTTRGRCRSTTSSRSRSFRRARPWACSSWNPLASKTSCPGCSPATRRTSSPTSVSSAPGRSPEECPSGTSLPVTAALPPTPTRTSNPCSPTPTA